MKALGWRLMFWLVVAAVIVVLAYLAVRRFGLVGGLVLAPIAAGGAVVGVLAKTAGAKPIPKNDSGRPRRPGTSAVSPEPEPGKRRARPRRNNWR